MRDSEDEETDMDKPLSASEIENDDYVRIAVSLLREHLPLQETMRETLARSMPCCRLRLRKKLSVKSQSKQSWIGLYPLYQSPLELPDLQISFEQENDFGIWQGITPPFVSDRKLRIKVQLENKKYADGESVGSV